METHRRGSDGRRVFTAGLQARADREGSKGQHHAFQQSTEQQKVEKAPTWHTPAARPAIEANEGARELKAANA